MIFCLVLDAMGKPTSGAATITIMDLGSQEQCYNVKTKSFKSEASNLVIQELKLILIFSSVLHAVAHGRFSRPAARHTTAAHTFEQ